MTIERPYQRALSVEEALAEIERNRGTQFVPAVVDAFFRTVEKRPQDFGASPDEALAAG